MTLGSAKTPVEMNCKSECTGRWDNRIMIHLLCWWLLSELWQEFCTGICTHIWSVFSAKPYWLNWCSVTRIGSLQSVKNLRAYVFKVCIFIFDLFNFCPFKLVCFFFFFFSKVFGWGSHTQCSGEWGHQPRLTTYQANALPAVLFFQPSGIGG